MEAPRSATLIVVFVAIAFSLLTVTTDRPATAQAPSAGTALELKRQAAKAQAELSKATKDWEAHKSSVDASETKLQKTLTDLGAADAALNKIRGPVAQLAAIAYKQPGGMGAPDVIGSGDPDQALRGATDMTMLSNSQSAMVKKAAQLSTQREQLATSAQDLQSRTAVEQTKLQQEITSLKAKSQRVTQQLTAALKKLDRSTRLQLTCSKSLVPQARQFPNGLIPSKYLCPLPQKGRSLRADAALAFYRLNNAYKKRFGVQMCLTDSYRPLGEQQQIYSQRPAMAAVPGHSNHGFGTAIDVCGGVQTQGSVQFNWLRANSQKYDFFHPAWAYSSPFEPWHWEYTKENTNT